VRILVTGGGGFIGSALVLYLVKKGDKVTVFDNFSNSEKKIDSSEGIKVIKGDITDYNSLEKAIQNHDVVIHLAAKIDVNESILKPDETFAVNVDGTENVIKACLKNKIKNIVAISSAAVYGESKKLPVSETSPLQPMSPYGQSKMQMEKILEEYAIKYRLNIINLRLFNVYGKNQSAAYAGVITKFIDNIKNNKPLVIFGDGSNTRDFISIEDVVYSIHKSIEHLENKRGNAYNIASGESISINDLAKLLLSISGKKIDIQFKQAKQGDIKKSETLVELASRELNFETKINLEEGLKKNF
jgi:UDP-glucose 4-epimerase